MKKIKIATIISLLLILILFLFYQEGSLPVNKKITTTKIFVIRKGDSITTIAKNLEKENLIRNRIVFFLIVKKLGIEQNIQAGDYRLSSALSTEQIASSLTKGTLDQWITIIEGWRKEEAAQIISRELDLPESEFIKTAKEGFLFPDTYLIPRSATLNVVFSVISKNFDVRYNQALKKKDIDNGLSQDEIITLASLIEKEARTEKNKNIIASILYKRLKNNWPLQVDASIQYALGYQIAEKSWWKRKLTLTDLNIESPYNTYKNQGLPPTPICNPGLISIIAAMNASENTPYWFYLTSKDGTTMHYATTIEEHNNNIKNYLR